MDRMSIYIYIINVPADVAALAFCGAGWGARPPVLFLAVAVFFFLGGDASGAGTFRLPEPDALCATWDIHAQEFNPPRDEKNYCSASREGYR